MRVIDSCASVCSDQCWNDIHFILLFKCRCSNVTQQQIPQLILRGNLITLIKERNEALIFELPCTFSQPHFRLNLFFSLPFPKKYTSNLLIVNSKKCHGPQKNLTLVAQTTVIYEDIRDKVYVWVHQPQPASQTHKVKKQVYWRNCEKTLGMTGHVFFK